ncbi:START domain-containing protein [Marinobacter koreensis]|uniref:START domain-containing protein n=1 Tax=Marinobacter koreensis TaxID=335974 RepID=A0ABW0RNT0_9GAMM|nr:START domain-containing protein [Marinobacter koreensis]MCK7549286.1 START domain-containing protein [Marinobacter koreensis]
MMRSTARGWTGQIFRHVMLVTLTLLSASSAALAQSPLPDENQADWQLQTETDNIRIYTTKQPGSTFEAFKAVAVLDAPIENLMAVMINPRSCVEWVYNCSESYGFGEGDFHDRFAYSVNDMPWPVTDRDYVLRIRTRGDHDSGEIVMDLNATPDQRAESSGRVRVDQSDTLYRFIPEGGKTRMIWIQHTNPNGALPGWLVNSLLVDIPVRSMEALEEVAQKPRYQGFRLVWDKQGHLAGVEKSVPQGGDGSDNSR